MCPQVLIAEQDSIEVFANRPERGNVDSVVQGTADRGNQNHRCRRRRHRSAPLLAIGQQQQNGDARGDRQSIMPVQRDQRQGHAQADCSDPLPQPLAAALDRFHDEERYNHHRDTVGDVLPQGNHEQSRSRTSPKTRHVVTANQRGMPHCRNL